MAPIMIIIFKNMLTVKAVLYHNTQREFHWVKSKHRDDWRDFQPNSHRYAAPVAEPSQATGRDLPGSRDLAFRAEGQGKVNGSRCVYARPHRQVVRVGGGVGGGRRGAGGAWNAFTHPALPVAGLQEAKALAVVAPRLVQGVHKRPGAVDVALPVSVS